jgi:hypothetical protein
MNVVRLFSEVLMAEIHGKPDRQSERDRRGKRGGEQGEYENNRIDTLCKSWPSIATHSAIWCSDQMIQMTADSRSA